MKYYTLYFELWSVDKYIPSSITVYASSENDAEIRAQPYLDRVNYRNLVIVAKA